MKLDLNKISKLQNELGLSLNSAISFQRELDKVHKNVKKKDNVPSLEEAVPFDYDEKLTQELFFSKLLGGDLNQEQNSFSEDEMEK